VTVSYWAEERVSERLGSDLESERVNGRAGVKGEQGRAASGGGRTVFRPTGSTVSRTHASGAAGAGAGQSAGPAGPTAGAWVGLEHWKASGRRPVSRADTSTYVPAPPAARDSHVLYLSLSLSGQSRAASRRAAAMGGRRSRPQTPPSGEGGIMGPLSYFNRMS
jgi:hypothetical protein